MVNAFLIKKRCVSIDQDSLILLEIKPYAIRWWVQRYQIRAVAEQALQAD